MPCPACSAPDVDPSTSAFCRHCGYRLTASPTDPPETPATPPPPGLPITVSATPSPGHRHRAPALWIAAALCVAIAVAVFWMWLIRTPTAIALLPRDTVGVVSADGKWWWDATVDIRQDASVRPALEEAERTLGLSLERDVAPWIGQMGAALLDGYRTEPRVLAFAQVRDWPAFLRCATKYRSKVASASGSEWKETTYHGTTVWRLQREADSGSGAPPVAMAWIKGWFLLGVGENVLESGLDTVAGRSQSVAKAPGWSTALGRLPEHPVLWTCADGNALNAEVNAADLPGFLRDHPVRDTVGVMSLYEQDKGLRLDTVSAATSDRAREFWRKLKGNAAPVSDAALGRLPDDVSIVVAINDPNGWWTRIRDILREATPAASVERESLERGLREMQPVERILANYPGQCSAGLIWRENQGFGAMAVAQSRSGDTARESAQALADLAKKNGSVPRVVDNTWTLPDQERSDATGSLLPCWQVQNEFLLLATHPNWLSSAASGRSAPRLSGDARRADFVITGSFRALPSLLRSLETGNQIGPSDRSMLEVIRALHLEPARWTAWTTLADDGGTQQASLSIEDWDWRAAVRGVLQEATRMSGSDSGYGGE